MSNIGKSPTFALGGRIVNRLGFGAMQLAGPGVFGPPKDRANAVAVLREAVAHGVNHIDTSDFYGPHVTNQIIREALHPYPDGLMIVTKVGAKRGSLGSVIQPCHVRTSPKPFTTISGIWASMCLMW
jgi:pyridoxine 4-dehydrogenase